MMDLSAPHGHHIIEKKIRAASPSGFSRPTSNSCYPAFQPSFMIQYACPWIKDVLQYPMWT